MMETTLVDRAITALQQMGLKVLVQKQPRATQRVQVDAMLRIAGGNEPVDYVVEEKRALTPSTMGAAVAQLGNAARATRRQSLLVTEYVTPPLADKLRQQQQQFADAVGNAYLEGPGLLVYVAGRRPQDKRATAKTTNIFTTNGLKVLFALICNPALAQAPQRMIAAAAGVALGAVPAILRDLQQPGYLLAAGKRRSLNTTKRLLDEWALAYARTLRAKTLQAAYLTPSFDDWKNWKLDPKRVLWGGEPAAALLVGVLRPGILTLYADRLPPSLIVEQRMTMARSFDADRQVEFRKPFWGEMSGSGIHPQTVSAVLIYADLLATGNARCIEAAQAIYDTHLARLFPAA